MDTTQLTAALFATMTVACAPIGQPRGDGSGPDAGTSAAKCDSPTVKTMDLTLTGNDAVGNLPSGCWQLDGKLTINGTTSSLAKLGDLRQVKDLIINGSSLTSIAMDAPLTVTRKLDIEGSKLTTLDNIILPDDASCLTYLDSVTVTGNAALTDLGGVADLTCVSGAVKISNNVELAQIRLGKAQRLEGGLEISYNNKLTSIALPTVYSITGDLTISNNTALTTFSSLAALKYLHGSVTITNNAALTALPSEMVTPRPSVEGNLNISSNPKLVELGAFDHLQGVNLLVQITGNTSLDVCEAKAVGCCVYHPGTANLTGNRGTSCSTKPWCIAGTSNSCPYSSQTN